jgi:hypothetical protein
MTLSVPNGRYHTCTKVNATTVSKSTMACSSSWLILTEKKSSGGGSPAGAACHQLIVEILPVLAGEIRGTNQPGITP